MRVLKVTWEKKAHEEILVLLVRLVQKVRRAQREVRGLEEKLELLDLLETKENAALQDLLAIQEVLVKREIKVPKEAMAHLALKERGDEWVFQENEDKLVQGDSGENAAELGVKDFLVLKETLGNPVLLDQLDLLVKMDQKDNEE